jgi:hypothetical protein
MDFVGSGWVVVDLFEGFLRLTGAFLGWTSLSCYFFVDILSWNS